MSYRRVRSIPLSAFSHKPNNMFLTYQFNTKKFFSFRNILIALLIIALILTNVRNCTVNKSLANTIDSLTLVNQTLDSIKNRQDQTILTQTAIVTNQQEDIKRISQEKFDLARRNERLVRTVLAYQSETTEIRLDSVEVPFVSENERAEFTDSIRRECAEVINFYEANYVGVPKHAEDSTTHYNIDLTVTQRGVMVNSLVIPDSNYFRIIEKKGGFFRKVHVRDPETGEVKKKLRFHVPRTIEFQSFHTNPLVKVTGQTSVYYVPKAKAKWLGKALLVGAGIYIGTKL